MNKVIKLLLVALCLNLTGCATKSFTLEELNNFTEFVELFSEKEFFSGTYKRGVVELKNRRFKIIETIVLSDEMKKNISNFNIRNFGNRYDIINFPFGGAVDDNWGILYSKNHVDSVSGIKSLRKLTDKLYYYSTLEDDYDITVKERI